MLQVKFVSQIQWGMFLFSGEIECLHDLKQFYDTVLCSSDVRIHPKFLIVCRIVMLLKHVDCGLASRIYFHIINIQFLSI